VARWSNVSAEQQCVQLPCMLAGLSAHFDHPSDCCADLVDMYLFYGSPSAVCCLFVFVNATSSIYAAEDGLVKTGTCMHPASSCALDRLVLPTAHGGWTSDDARETQRAAAAAKLRIDSRFSPALPCQIVRTCGE